MAAAAAAAAPENFRVFRRAPSLAAAAAAARKRSNVVSARANGAELLCSGAVAVSGRGVQSGGKSVSRSVDGLEWNGRKAQFAFLT